MGLTFVQSVSGISGAGATSFGLAYGSNTTGSSYLLALGVVSGLAAVTITATDGLGNTWSQIGSNISDGINQYALFQVPTNAVGGGADTVTLHSTVSSTLALVLAEYTGQASSNPLDSSSTFTSASTGTITIGPTAGNQTNEEFIALGWCGTTASVVANSGYTTRHANNNYVIVDEAFSVTGSNTGGWTMTASSVAAWLLSVKSTTSAAPSTPSTTTSPDGRIASDGSCFGCNSPSGFAPPAQQWGIWIGRYGGGWMWLSVPPPPAPPNYVRTTPASTGALDKAQANPIQFSSPGQGNTAPNAGQPIAVSGATGSTANPIVDVIRKVAGQVPGTNVVVNLPG
jgi:hypothetical protein